MIRLSEAEITLRELGISDPSEIDLEAIAWTLNARVKYRPLDGCEARIIGHGDQAIITVNSRSIPRRQRFSLAHELGHWRYHRGRLLVCRSDDIGRAGNGQASSEREADRYAADILMPLYLFQPLAKEHKKFNFQVIRSLADLFDTSLTATAIRAVEGEISPSMLVCHGMQGRKWFVRSPSVPEKWFPRSELHSDSFAFDVLFGKAVDDSTPRKIDADSWFDRYDASRYEIREQSVRTGENEILTLILIDDDQMLNESVTSYSRSRW